MSRLNKTLMVISLSIITLGVILALCLIEPKVYEMLRIPLLIITILTMVIAVVYIVGYFVGRYNENR